MIKHEKLLIYNVCILTGIPIFTIKLISLEIKCIF